MGGVCNLTLGPRLHGIGFGHSRKRVAMVLWSCNRPLLGGPVGPGTFRHLGRLVPFCAPSSSGRPPWPVSAAQPSSPRVRTPTRQLCGRSSGFGRPSGRLGPGGLGTTFRWAGG